MLSETLRSRSLDGHGTHEINRVCRLGWGWFRRSAHVPLEHLLSLIPCVKPRLYSIASSQRYHNQMAQRADGQNVVGNLSRFECLTAVFA